MAKGLKDFYKELKRYNNNVPYKLYKEILYKFIKFMMIKVLEGKKVRIPKRLGALEVIGKKYIPSVDEETGKIKGLMVDWVSTNKLWNANPKAKEKKELIYYLNEHTNNVRYRFFWSKLNIYSDWKDYYSLALARVNKRELARLIKEGKEYYVKPNKAK